jgi:hypothetical protein
MRFVLASFALVMAGCAVTPPAGPNEAVAAAPAAAAATQTAQADPDPSKKVCRRMLQTGSNYPKRVCSTAAEWAEFDRQGREGAARVDEQRRAGAPGTYGERPQP